MGQPAFFAPIMIKKWGNWKAKSKHFRGAFVLSFPHRLQAFLYGFYF
jgi:hypothetical protein